MADPSTEKDEKHGNLQAESVVVREIPFFQCDLEVGLLRREESRRIGFILDRKPKKDSRDGIHHLYLQMSTKPLPAQHWGFAESRLRSLYSKRGDGKRIARFL